MGSLLPPPQYDHPPAMPVLAYVLTEAEIQRVCTAIAGAPERGKVLGGCAGTIASPRWVGPQFIAMMGGVPVYWTPPNGPKCWVNIADNIKGALLKVVWRHELAHCNGWPANHPGGRAVTRGHQFLDRDRFGLLP
jgi:hypothetical protein